MKYAYREIPESELEVEIYELDQEVLAGDNLQAALIKKNQFEILDQQGDQIATVYSETEAEALVSHLNR